jgi:hypothetical protein
VTDLADAMAQTIIGRYRERHTISVAVVAYLDGLENTCGHCGIRVIARRNGLRHDPDEVQAVATAARRNQRWPR